MKYSMLIYKILKNDVLEALVSVLECILIKFVNEIYNRNRILKV